MRIKQAPVINDFDLLIAPGNLGFYNAFEITSCYLIDGKGIVHNLYTIFVATELIKPFESEQQEVCITPKPITIRKSGYKYGISRKMVSLDDGKRAYESLSELKKNSINFGLGELQVGELTEIPQQFIPHDSTKCPIVNKVLKNNNESANGCYIIEFFEKSKFARSFLKKEKDFLFLCEEIRRHIPIDLTTLEDKVNGIIFQFPSQIISLDTDCYPNRNSPYDSSNLQASLKADLRIDPKKHTYEIIVETKHDDIISGYCNRVLIPNSNNSETVSGLNTAGDIVIRLVDNTTNLLQYAAESTLVRAFNINIGVSAIKNRIRRVNGQSVVLDDSSKESIIISDDNYAWETAYQQRNRKGQLTDLLKTLSFKAYYHISTGKRLDHEGHIINDENTAHEDALKDLRTIINEYGVTEVCIWDKYLSANDIFDTLYFCQNPKTRLRALSHFEKLQVQNQANMLSNADNTGLNLEVRKTKEDLDHDRFIICRYGRRCKTWSLGISVNQFGKAYHILQEVANPAYVADDFERVWDENSDEVVFKVGG